MNNETHWAVKSPGLADHYRREALAAREALDFDPASEEIAPFDLVQKINTLRALQSEQERQEPTHRHKKRGSEYVLIGIGKMQAENWRSHPFGQDTTSSYDAPVDMREVAVYRSVDDGSLWARPIEEFEDGRFEALTTGGAK